MRRYGWTWVACDPWGYPTHHYGRWQLSARGSWFWVPSRQWGPAWVYWATTPTYVGWCPLGWNGRPVVNVFTYGGGHHGSSRWRDPYRAWTVLPTGSFGRGHVPRYRVDRTILDRDRPTFVMQHVPPGFAPPRRPTYQRADGSGALGRARAASGHVDAVGHDRCHPRSGYSPGRSQLAGVWCGHARHRSRAPRAVPNGTGSVRSRAALCGSARDRVGLRRTAAIARAPSQGSDGCERLTVRTRRRARYPNRDDGNDNDRDRREPPRHERASFSRRRRLAGAPRPGMSVPLGLRGSARSRRAARWRRLAAGRRPGRLAGGGDRGADRGGSRGGDSGSHGGAAPRRRP